MVKLGGGEEGLPFGRSVGGGRSDE